MNKKEIIRQSKEHLLYILGNELVKAISNTDIAYNEAIYTIGEKFGLSRYQVRRKNEEIYG